MKNVKFSTFALVAVVAVCAGQVHAQTQSPVIGNGGGSIDQQIIGDTVSTADHTNSVSTQLGNSANNNGAQMHNNVDTRDQNTVTSTGGAATGGAAIGNQSSNDNKSNANASNGPQTMGQANTGNSTVGNTTATSGPSTSNSGGNTLGGASATNGPISNQNVASGGAGGKGGAGGAGGSASSTGTNLGINGQQQGIDRSGNSANANTMTGGANTAAQGQGQGQTSANRNSQSTSAGNGAGAGAGSNNRTAMTVDASDRSSTSYVAKSIALPPVLHGQAAPPLASAAMTVIPGVCGPRHYTETVPVLGTHHGILWDSTVPQGNDYTAVPATTPFIEKDGYLIGHMLNEFVAVVGTSSSKSISGWGVGKEQNGGGGGAANSGSHQQIVVRITVKDCLMPVAKPAPVVAPLPPVRPIELPARADRS